MKSMIGTTQKMVREAFGLLLTLRERENADVLLAQANAFLGLLERGKQVNDPPVILSVRVMQVRKPG